MYQNLRKERVLASPQFDGTSFFNTTGIGLQTISREGFLPLMREFLLARGERVPRRKLPLFDPISVWSRKPQTDLRVTWLGHSTCLFEMNNQRFVIDPVFGERASPVSFLGPKRFHPTPCKVEDLLPLDFALLSHDHYDHLCESTVLKLAKANVPIVTSLGVGHHLERLGIPHNQIHELDWYESWINKGLQVRATPCQHFSGRGLMDRNMTLWSSWIFESDTKRVFFSGDSGLSNQFQDIGDKYGPFDLALLEVGAFHPNWAAVHMGPENALKVFRMLKAKSLLPVHWGTFCLALHAWNEPAETLFNLTQATGEKLLTPLIGQPIELDHSLQNYNPESALELRPWWRP